MANKTRNEVAVGITVLIVIALTTYIVVVLADWSTLSVPQQEITVNVHYKVGLKGLQVGSPVHLGGVKVGNVTRTGISPLNSNAGDSNDLYVFFTMQIPRQYRLRSDCVLTPQSNLLGGQSFLAIEDLGSHGDIVTDGQTIELTFADDMLALIRREFNATDPCSLMARVKSEIPAVSQALRRALTKLDSVFDDAKVALHEFSPKDPNTLMAHTKEDFPVVMGKLKSTLANADSTFQSAKAALSEFDPNDPNSLLAQTKDDLLAITGQLRKSAAKADSALNDAQTTLQNLKEVTADERINSIIENVREVSANFKLTSQNIRRAPWKLFYRPKKEESDMQALLDSTAAFVAGAERLDSAALRLQKLAGKTGDQLPIDTNRIEAMLSELQTSFEQFQQAEQKFWESLP